MEETNKRRSGSFGSQKASSDEARRLSVSDGSNVDKESSPTSNISPGSSEAGTLKKPKKFRPKKFIAKLKLKKSEKNNDEHGLSTAEGGHSEQETSKKSAKEKLSPKLQRFNFVKRFSGTKSYKVTPGSGSMEEGIDKAKSNLKTLETFSFSDTNMKKADDEPTTQNVSFKEAEKFVSQVDIPLVEPTNLQYPSTISKEAVTLESKKVELKITISGKTRGSPSPNASERAVDKASPTTQFSNEPSRKSTDIILPSTSTQVRLSTSRDQFFKTLAPRRDDANVEQSVKLISEEIANPQVTFAEVVKDGLSVKSTPAKSSNEVEKYLILTSSLNTIISAAKELDDLGSDVKDLKFPKNIPELKIREGTSETEETGNHQENRVEKRIAQEVIEPALASSTPVKRESSTTFKTTENLEAEEMKKQGRQSRIPVDQRRLPLPGASESTDKESTPTVHTQEAHKPYHLNLSSTSSEDSSSKPSPSEEPSSGLKAEEIKFHLGTPVRPLRTSPAASTLALTESQLVDVNINDSSDEIFHSPKSEKSFPSESTRRRIPYVPQLTIYTPEEQELLKSKIHSHIEDSLDVSSLPPDSSIFPVFGDSVEGTMTGEKREHLYKILVIGELGTGKTSFIKRYVHQFFSQNYRATIGVDFALKVLNWDQSTIIRLQLWDIAGQERFGNMTRVYYKEAVGAFIVFDVTRSATFDAVLKWKQDLDSKVSLPDGSQIPCVLLANKCDQQKQGLVTMPAKMDEYCKQNGFSGWFETSAKDNVNIEESAKALVSKILINDKLINNDIDGGTIVLNAEDAANQKKKFCSC